jgi:neopullulanase
VIKNPWLLEIDEIRLQFWSGVRVKSRQTSLFIFNFYIYFSTANKEKLMSVIKYSYLIVFLLIRIISAQPSIEKIEPPNWWSGMKMNQIQLMVYGSDLKDAKVSFEPPDIKINSISEIDNKGYAFVNIEIPENAADRNYKLIFEKNGRRTEKEFPLLKREAGIRHQGFDQSDVIYLIMPDRFVNGDPSNDNFKGFIDSLDRQKQDGRHGGDIKGIINSLDYLKNLGVTTLWLTPLVENNTPMSYHGYGATDFYKIDPRQGSNDLYKTLVTEAHKKGLKIIIDHVSNHFHKNHPWMKNLPVKDWIHGTLDDHLSADHNKMVFADPYRDTVSIKKVSEGWFTNYLADLNQANELVKNYIIQNTIWWIEYAGLDGIREDTYPYADQKFLAEWAEVILEEYPTLNIVGEVWTGEPAYLAPFQKGSTARGFDSNLPALTDFGIRDKYYDFLTGRGTLFNIYETFTKDYLYTNPDYLVTFIDNHDIARGLYYAKGDLNKMKIALLLLLTTRGIPQLLYGTETTLTGGEGHGTLRFDFPGGFNKDSINYFTKINMSREQVTYFNYIQKLLSLRKDYKALSEGNIKHFPPRNGMYIYFKQSEDELFMIVINEKSEEQSVDLPSYEKYISNKNLIDVISGQKITAQKELIVPGVTGNIYKVE